MKPLALTCGDPAGVGPEIIAAWLAAQPAGRTEVAVIGPQRWLDSLPTGPQKVAVGLEDFAATPGRPDGDGALVAWAAMERAALGTQAGEFSGVVTGPVSKERLAAIGYPHPGQTEFFAASWGGDPVMGFCGGRLRVALATWHIPLHQVGRALGPHLLHRTVAAAAELARADGIAVPRIGVCGLNPHAGEGGLLGYEEKDFLNPALEHLQPEFPGLSLCQPGDTLFARALRGEFDVVVALYHDQGLAPLKTVDFDEAVNVSLGLPFVRTSPDHGTAFGIAGQGKASPRSFANAVEVARRLIKLRSGA
ncbi:4-hydroxythreonine-4-phosphate dehydrogenase PdxA [Oleiharenicola lentus]|uniref:4-hydroxythreonine-4-phosphate dehydrogenase PdxA n=1 Tax=Oleiharenicola lentus TaxID=2508720 RepID=A0A4Q1C7N0_9BACT|nr:4-hydroxythreonine-4-phosphate dehydrogenase PdxA [Oleiharenicola lentus]RXK54927.1 4-hydroxythreonine-4-phosphate dehydrogenase PdxA [Oleiharenicola lentus]